MSLTDFFLSSVPLRCLSRYGLLLTDDGIEDMLPYIRLRWTLGSDGWYLGPPPDLRTPSNLSTCARGWLLKEPAGYGK